MFVHDRYLRRSILPLRWIVFSSHTATLLHSTLQHNNYLKYLTKFSLWFFLPRNIIYAYGILFYTVMTENLAWKLPFSAQCFFSDIKIRVKKVTNLCFHAALCHFSYITKLPVCFELSFSGTRQVPCSKIEKNE